MTKFNDIKKKWNGKSSSFEEKQIWKTAMSTPFGKMVIEEILEITNKFKVDFSKAHEIWAISNYIGISIDSAKECVLDDADGGIDAWYYDEELATLTLIQAKLKRIKKESILKLKDAYKKNIMTKEILSKNSKNLKIISEKVDWNNLKHIKYVGIHPIQSQNEMLTIDEDSRIVGWDVVLKEAIDNINKKVLLSIKKYMNNFEGEEVHKLESPFFIKINIKELTEKINKFNKYSQEALFNANVRADVSKRKHDFKNDIKNTLINEPENFELYNNGLTLVATKINNNSGGNFSFINPQIINGQQTLRTLIAFSKKEEISDKAFIFAKAIETNEDELIMNIAKYSNTQSAIKTANLISTTKAFKNLNLKCNKNNLYLIAKEGASLRKELYKKLQMKSIDIKTLIKIYIANKKIEDIPKAKANIGLIITNYITKNEIENMDYNFIKKAFKIYQKKKSYINYFKQLIIDQNGKEKGKAINKIWGIAEMAIYRMLILDFPKNKIFEKITKYQQEFDKDSIINSFKVNEAYEKLNLINL